MQIWTPDECKKLYVQTTEHFGKLHPITAFKIADYWLPCRLDILNAGYGHNLSYIDDALGFIDWPDMDYVLSGLTVYVLEHPSHDQWNGEAGSVVKGDNHDSHIILFGRTTPIPKHMTAYVFAHELGHVIQEIYCREQNLIEEYGRLRGVDCSRRSAEWINDWKQLWAEDFRWLFTAGPAHQNSWSMVMSPPSRKIRDFMVDLIYKYHRSKEDGDTGD